MKITVSINLGGYFFNIDEDAYAELKLYLRNLELHFAEEESSAEILSDIETRMSEIFRTKLSTFKKVITIEDVRESISILGRPEDIGESTGTPKRENYTSAGHHHLYRDPEHRMLGGVCGGMAAYWDMEIWIVRLLFVVTSMAGGIGAFVYFILWIVVPEARTTAQKMEMKGGPVNIQDIKDSVKKEVDNVRKTMNI